MELVTMQASLVSIITLRAFSILTPSFNVTRGCTMIRVTGNAPPRKVTNQGFANAIISTCTEFLVGTGT
jgi:hypothetical protein